MLDALLPALGGAAVGWAVGKSLDLPLSYVARSLRKKWRLVRSRSGGLESVRASFWFGARETSVVILDGDGSQAFASQNISATVAASRVVPVGGVASCREQYERAANARSIRGESAPWDGELLSVAHYSSYRTGRDEELSLRLRLHPTTYFEVASVIESLRGEDPHGFGDYIGAFGFDGAEDYRLPNGLGICLTVTTTDGRMVFARRSSSSGLRPGEHDVAVVEGVLPSRDVVRGRLDVHGAARRAFCEEVCEIDADESIVPQILGLIFDKAFNQWNLVGTIAAPFTQDELIRRQSSGFAGRWELVRHDFVRLDLEEIARYCGSRRMWDSALAALYLTLVFHGFGRGAIDRSIARHADMATGR